MFHATELAPRAGAVHNQTPFLLHRRYAADQIIHAERQPPYFMYIPKSLIDKIHVSIVIAQCPSGPRPAGGDRIAEGSGRRPNAAACEGRFRRRLRAARTVGYNGRGRDIGEAGSGTTDEPRA